MWNSTIVLTMWRAKCGYSAVVWLIFSSFTQNVNSSRNSGMNASLCCRWKTFFHSSIPPEWVCVIWNKVKKFHSIDWSSFKMINNLFGVPFRTLSYFEPPSANALLFLIQTRNKKKADSNANVSWHSPFHLLLRISLSVQWHGKHPRNLGALSIVKTNWLKFWRQRKKTQILAKRMAFTNWDWLLYRLTKAFLKQISLIVSL